MNVKLMLHAAPLPALWGLPPPPPSFVATGIEWAPLDPDGGPPPALRAVIVAAALRLGCLSYLGDPPSTGMLPWRSPRPSIQITDEPTIAEAMFESAASWSQQGQAVAVLPAGADPDATVLAQAAPARGGNVARLCESPDVLLFLLPAIDGTAVGTYARDIAAITWDAALADCARSAGLLLSDLRAWIPLG